MQTSEREIKHKVHCTISTDCLYSTVVFPSGNAETEIIRAVFEKSPAIRRLLNSEPLFMQMQTRKSSGMQPAEKQGINIPTADENNIGLTKTGFDGKIMSFHRQIAGFPASTRRHRQTRHIACRAGMPYILFWGINTPRPVLQKILLTADGSRIYSVFRINHTGGNFRAAGRKPLNAITDRK